MPDGTQISRTPSAALLTLPNAITFARLCAVPASVYLVVAGQPALAFFLFVAAGLSDAVDGWLARRRGGSALGAVLDPVADKALLVSMYITLASVGELPAWLAILVVFRDAVIVGGVLVLALIGQPVAIHPLYVSKLNTALQIVLVATTLFMAGFLADYSQFAHAPQVKLALIWAVGLTTLASGGAYVWNAVRAR
jgi:cardiolipin synthase